ncbi:hypothetical protein ABZ368_29625 [Streptomyces sp. NPDC005908]|uniref:hypothetical protein n=1 Tax=Streptomyces sp. NPDC005908 TaxID=3157084 RepID=UPI0033FAA70D
MLGLSPGRYTLVGADLCLVSGWPGRDWVRCPVMDDRASIDPDESDLEQVIVFEPLSAA